MGATDENDQIADFSSRGPSTFGKVNPDVSAPGVDVVSSVPGDGYDSFSGTSMAAPHTAGTLALVLSAELALLGNVDGSTDAVRSTALDIADDSCGGDEDGDPNNVYGDGRIDAQAAVALVATGGTLAGDVTDVVSSDPIAGARIEATHRRPDVLGDDRRRRPLRALPRRRHLHGHRVRVRLPVRPGHRRGDRDRPDDDTGLLPRAASRSATSPAP